MPRESPLTSSATWRLARTVQYSVITQIRRQRMHRRHLVAFAALATAGASALPPGLGPVQRDQDRPHLQQDRPARSLRQADPDRLHDGPGLRHRRHHDGQRQEDRRDREGRPGQARPRQVAAGRRLCRRQGRRSRSARRLRASRWRCCRWPRNTRRSCWSSPRWPIRSPATSGTSTSSAPAATARRTRSRNAVALDKPGVTRSPRWRRTTPSAATA